MAHQVVTFIDLAGHEKYLKTTIFGMTGHAPDFCMLMIGSNAGVNIHVPTKCVDQFLDLFIN